MSLNISDLRYGEELLKTGFAKMTKEDTGTTNQNYSMQALVPLIGN